MKDENDYYYDAMDYLEGGSVEQAIKILNKALILNPDSVQAHLGMAEAYHVGDDYKNARNWIDLAYKKIKKVFPSWPRRLLWGDIDNRAYLRVIAHKADFLCDEGKKDEALTLYKLLIKLNPNDNQGIRYLISGIYAGLTGQDVNRMFDEGNKKQNWDKLEEMLKKQNKTYKFWIIPK